jgi:hypothetical protein
VYCNAGNYSVLEEIPALQFQLQVLLIVVVCLVIFGTRFFADSAYREMYFWTKAAQVSSEFHTNRQF